MLPTRLLPRQIAALALAVGLWLPAWARAQPNQPHIHLNNVLEQEPVPGAAGLPALALTMDFTVLDAAQEVIGEAQPSAASLQLESGAVYTATVQQIEVPWSIVLVLDASKTLTGFTASAAFKTARFALADALKQAPDNSNIALLTFGTRPTTVLDFTRDKDLLDTTLRTKVRAFSDQNTCLNDGVYEAVNKLSGASGRRAVLVFTASSDGCGTRPAQDVVDLATRNHIEIFGVGLRGYSISDGELGALTKPTGGLETLREQDDLLFGFQNVMNVLANQWQAKATLYPSAGPQTASLSITLQDETILVSDPISFEADQNYAQPPAIAVRGTVQSTVTGLRFSLNLTSPELIDHLTVNVVSKTTGNAVISQTVNEIREAYDIPVENLETEQDYTLVVDALDSRDQLLSQASLDFKYQPPTPVLSILQIDPPTEDAPVFNIQVDSLNLENAVKYKAWLAAGGQGASPDPIANTTVIVPVGDPLGIPVADLPTGSYLVVVQALDTANTVLAQDSSEPLTYESPSPFEALLKRVGETRMAILATTLICVAVFAVAGVVGGIVLLRRSARPKQVMLVLPERKYSAAAPPPMPIPSESNLDRPTRIPEAPSYVQTPSRPLAPSEPMSLPAVLPPACLASQEPAEFKFSVAVDRTPFTIGRREGNDLVIRVGNRSGMSGRHATVTFSGGRFYVQDDFSSFGTKLNGEKLQPGIPSPLEGEALIELGPSVKMKFAPKACGE